MKGWLIQSSNIRLFMHIAGHAFRQSSAEQTHSSPPPPYASTSSLTTTIPLSQNKPLPVSTKSLVVLEVEQSSEPFPGAA